MRLLHRDHISGFGDHADDRLIPFLTRTDIADIFVCKVMTNFALNYLFFDFGDGFCEKTSLFL